MLTDEVQEPAERKDAYDCDVTYCSPRQVAFDYLRDRMTMGHRRDRLDLQLRTLSDSEVVSPLLMRGLCFAIVDEADSVLIDDACTPLILSQTRQEAPQDDAYVWALELASHLEAGQDFAVEAKYREVLISYEGYEHISELMEELVPPANAGQEQELLVSQALQAIHCYQCDREYLVRDGKIEIIDANTGRAQPDHAWERGLHQMIEAKEGCELTPQRETIARMSYQRFFRRYLHLGGMTGTASEVAAELWSVYRQQVVRIPTRVPSCRVAQGTTFYASAEDKWAGVAERTEALQRRGRPTLIGTQSVEETEHLSRILVRRGVTHKVLNARQDKEEAEIVAQAGQPGAVTVATNMAGRGTDIGLPEEVVDAGGLHVIVAGRNESRRVDRQLIGRCARQGDPGSFELMLSLEDELLKKQLPASLITLTHVLSSSGIGLPKSLLMRIAQTLAERHGAAVRRGVLRFDDQMTERLAFSGPIE